MECKIGKFDSNRITWPRYADQMRLFLMANKVDDDLKVPTVLTVIGDVTFNLLNDLVAPAKPGDMGLQEIFSVLDRHFNPKPLSRIERFNLRKRRQQADESVTEFAAALRKLSVNCELEGKLNFYLVDQFIYGLNDTSIQKRLMIEANEVEFNALLQIAVAAESSTKASSKLGRELDHPPPVREMFSLKKTFKDCKHCGGKNHAEKFCRFKSATCYGCGVQGHLKSICRKAVNSKIKKKTMNIKKTIGEQENSGDNSCEEDGDRTSHFSDSECNVRNILINTLTTLEHEVDYPIQLNLNIDNVNINFILDTGSPITIMPKSSLDHFFPKRKLKPTNILLKTFNEQICKPVGYCFVKVKREKFLAERLELFITEKGDTPLLGRAWFNELGINMENIFHPTPSPPSTQNIGLLSELQESKNTCLMELCNILQREIQLLTPSPAKEIQPVTPQTNRPVQDNSPLPHLKTKRNKKKKTAKKLSSNSSQSSDEDFNYSSFLINNIKVIPKHNLCYCKNRTENFEGRGNEGSYLNVKFKH